jgi:hypothetical protein
VKNPPSGARNRTIATVDAAADFPDPGTISLDGTFQLQ